MLAIFGSGLMYVAAAVMLATFGSGLMYVAAAVFGAGAYHVVEHGVQIPGAADYIN